jgi:hypothetical protein
MFLASAIGSRLATRFPVRSIVRAGLSTTGVAVLVLLATIDPTLDDLPFALAMALLGAGMGLMASQLGNVVQSSVDASGRSEAGGLQYTGQQLGSSLGVALIGAIVLTGLTSVFVANVEADDRIDPAISAEIRVAAGTGVDFVSADQIGLAAEEAGLDAGASVAVAANYEDAQLKSLKAGLLAAAALAFGALFFTRDLPHGRPGSDRSTAQLDRDPAA